MSDAEPSVTLVLTMWDLGLVTSDDVVGWADRRILALDTPPIDIIELSAEGPEACLAREPRDFEARLLPLTFQEAFAIKAVALDLSNDEDVLAFARWAGRSLLHGPMDTEIFSIHHWLDDAIGYVSTQESIPDLLQIVREELPALLPRCAEIARPVTNESPDVPRTVADLIAELKGSRSK